MIKNIVFDLGGVLIDWDPRHLYRKVFSDPIEMEAFLADICTSDWNEQQDAGRSLQKATDLLISSYPNYTKEICMFYGRWEEMLNGAIQHNLEVFRALRDATDYPIYALTNWSAETMPIAWPHFPFLQEFDGMIVSGTEKVKKPDPRIFKILLDRFGLLAEDSVFLDDNHLNIQAAQRLNFETVHVTAHSDLRHELQMLGVIF